MPEFFETRMGQKFYEATMPTIAAELKRLCDLLERLVAAVEKGNAEKADADHADGK